MDQNKKAKPAQQPASQKESANKKPVNQHGNHFVKDVLSIVLGASVCC